MVEKVGFEGVFYTDKFMSGVKEYMSGLDMLESGTRSAATSISNEFKEWGRDIKSFYGVGKTVFNGLKTIYKSTVSPAIEYVDTVTQIATALGVSTEAASRYLAVMRQQNIDQSSMTTGMRYALDNGFNPTIQNLAVLSDKYLALQPGLERDKLLFDTFGKTGLEWSKVLVMGADNIRTAYAGVSDSLIVDAAAKESVDAYKQSVDKLATSWGALTTGVGLKVIPDLTKVVDLLNKIMINPSWKGLMDWTYDVDLSEGYNITGPNQIGMSPEQQKYMLAYMGLQGKLGKEVQSTTVEIKKETDALKENQLAALGADDAFSGLSDTTGKELVPAIKDMGNASKFGAQQVGIYGGTVNTTGEKGKTAAGKIRQLRDSLLESKLEAMDAEKPLRDVRDLFVDRLAHWTLQITSVGGGDIDFDTFMNQFETGTDWSATCFVGDTLVNTPKGFYKIKDICIGDTVITYDEKTKEFKHGKVIDIISSIRADLLTVKIWNRKIHCSPNHRFYTTRGWVEAQNLLSDDQVLVMDYGFIPVKTSRYFGLYKVYNLTVEDYHTYLVYNCVVHNKKFWAEGGAYPGNNAMIVGENGPELMFPNQPGQVISNAQILSALSDLGKMPIFSRSSMPSISLGGARASNNINNNWNFQLSTMSGPNVIQRSYEATRLINQ